MGGHGQDTEEFQWPHHDEQSRVANYFHLLATVNQSSRPVSPFMNNPNSSRKPGLDKSTMAQGYFHAFFREVRRLGMGANGTVLLCEHVLDGNSLGKI